LTLLVMPTYSCHLACAYCFESTIGWRMKVKLDYDLDRMMEAIARINRLQPHQEAVLHGGEPLLMPLRDLERLIAFIRNLGLSVSVQSSCSILSEEHIKLFKRYNVRVGCSADGPPELNVLRGFWPRGKPLEELNRRYREKVQRNIEILAEEKLLGGVLTIVHRANAGDVEKLRKLVGWINKLYELGSRYGRLNPMYAVTPWSKPYELSVDELYRAYVWMWENFFQDRPELDWSPYHDLVAVLLGQERRALCWFNGCGFYDAPVWTVGPKGEVLSCDRTLGAGMWLRARPLPKTQLLDRKIRAIALCQTELAGDRFCHLHKGGCPAEALGGDWRRPSRFWRLWSRLLEYFERRLKALAPWLKLASEVPDRLEYIEMVSRGCVWNPFTGRYDCPKGGRG